MTSRMYSGLAFAVVLFLSSVMLTAYAETQEPSPKSVPPGPAPVTLTPPPAAPVSPTAPATDGILAKSLDEALDTALRNNPDLLLAQANVRAAEAQLNKVRLEVVRDVSQAYRARQSMKESVSLAERGIAAGTLELKALTDAKIAQAESDAKLQYLLGSRTQSVVQQSTLAPRPDTGALVPKVLTELAPRPKLALESLSYGRTLETRATLSFTEAALSGICDFIQAQYDLTVVVDPEAALMTISRLEVHDMPLMDIFQVIVESGPAGVCVVFRDYGVLLTTVERAESISAPSLPPTVPLYVPARIAPAAETPPSSSPASTVQAAK